MPEWTFVAEDEFSLARIQQDRSNGETAVGHLVRICGSTASRLTVRPDSWLTAARRAVGDESRLIGGLAAWTRNRSATSESAAILGLVSLVARGQLSNVSASPAARGQMVRIVLPSTAPRSLMVPSHHPSDAAWASSALFM